MLKTIFAGRIYRWIARAKIMSQFSSSFLMSSKEDSAAPVIQ